MDTYDPATVYSSIDRRGRYAYGAQPAIIAWNMARLAQALLPVIDSEPEQAVAAAQELLDGFPDLMERAWLEVMAAKLGIASVRADDRQLIMSLLTAMDSGNADFTNTFRALVDAAGSEDGAADVRDQFDDPAVYDGWAPGWRERLAEEGDDGRLERMRRANPAFIPRNHRVEEALAAAIESDDYQPLESLMEVLRRPYDDQPEAADFREPPAPAFEDSYRTFCGT
jgi:uncharacterized protein YdiU (UPF0061 family)